MRGYDAYLEDQLNQWARWVLLIEKGQGGWQRESLVYRIQQFGGYAGNKPPSSTCLIMVSEYVDRLNGLINRLWEEHPDWSQAIYLRYTVRIKLKDLADEMGISPRTLRERVQNGKNWLAQLIN